MPRTGRFQISAISSAFDPLLGVFTGNTLESLARMAESDGSGFDNTERGCLATIEAVAGTTYRIVVDTRSVYDIGEFTLSITDSRWQAMAIDCP